MSGNSMALTMDTMAEQSQNSDNWQKNKITLDTYTYLYPMNMIK